MARDHRTIIVHCHIFKNAGSTFDWTLDRCLKDRFLNHRDEIDMRRGADYLGPFLEENSGLQAISSHNVQLPLPEVYNARLIPAFFIRQPIERAWSVYAFERWQPEETPSSRKAKQVSFRDYISWQMDPDTPPRLRNFQTRCCTPDRAHRRPREVSEADFEIAFNTLEGTPLVGVVDLFDESMTVMESALSEYFPEIDLAYTPQNLGKYRAAEVPVRRRLLRRLFRSHSTHRFILDATSGNTTWRAQWVLDRLGSEVGELLVRNNQVDLRLYTCARRLVLRRFRSLENCEKQLAAFRNRCTGLKEGTAEVQ